MRRYLLVANQTLGGQHLLDELARLGEDGPFALHVVVPATPASYQHLLSDEADPESIARDRLAEARERFGHLAQTITGGVGDPKPIEAIRSALQAHGPFEGIILSTLPSGLSRWIGMDLPRRVQREFDEPLIHVEAPAEVAGVEPGGIVVGVDGSDDAQVALRWAMAEAATHGTHVEAVHVFTYPSLVATGFPEVPVAEPIDYEAIEDRARQVLDEAIDRARERIGDDAPPVHRHVLAGSPALTLLRAAHSADLLVVGSRGVGGFRGLILGSVSQQVIQHAPCPVVVVPSTEPRSSDDR